MCEIQLAKNEKPVKAEAILEEIYPLMEEYFLGVMNFDGHYISYTLPNGQRIIISAEVA